MSIRSRFNEFESANPGVYEELVALARQAKRRGCTKIGIRMLWEVMRWNRMLRTKPTPGDVYKLNDHFHSRYARLIMAGEPDLDGFFEVRDLRS